MSTKKIKYPNLKNRGKPKNFKWLSDYDYLDKLSPAELDWLEKFDGEYYRGNIKKSDPKALHNKTEDLRKDCYRRKYRQQNDLQSIMDARGLMPRLENGQIISRRPRRSN